MDVTPQMGCAYIVHPDVAHIRKPRYVRDLSFVLEEAEGLVHAIGMDVCKTHVVKPKMIQAGAFLGKGQREDIAAEIKQLEPEIVVFNEQLSPVQQRNLEKEWGAKVIDRTGLILEIFGERAQTKEGRLQVALAALDYQRSRLVRSWTHLERQRGGAGFMGGPGERQIELDRRIIAQQMTRIKKELKDVQRTRDLGRQSRARVPFPIVALVGYTNAGKSTLFNRLTGANVFAEDLPFATLDPTMRRITLPNGQEVILSDTVGFIADLPTQLVVAFRATLEQVVHADVIVHVMDVSKDDYEEQRQDVITVLKELGVDYDDDPRVMEIYNKIDLCDDPDYLPNKDMGLSALTGEGVERFIENLTKQTSQHWISHHYKIHYQDGRALAWLHEHAEILEQANDENSFEITVRIDDAHRGKFKERFGYEPL